jgi:hypothetical protein
MVQEADRYKNPGKADGVTDGGGRDCFVVSLLAMTKRGGERNDKTGEGEWVIASEARQSRLFSLWS